MGRGLGHTPNMKSIVRDDESQITVIFDPESHLPLLIRSFEDHPIFGQIPKDIHLLNYTEVDGLMFPQSQKTFYKGDAIVEETEITRISVNPVFTENFFDGLDADETTSEPSPPKKVPGYGHGLLGQFWSNMLWGGQYSGTIGELEASNIADDLPRVHHLAFSNGVSIAQLVLEIGESVIVFESPHHQSDLVIQWVKETIGKPITHLWVSRQHATKNIVLTYFTILDFPSSSRP